MKAIWTDPDVALGAFGLLIVAVLLTWLIVGASSSATYSRNFEAACAAAGGKMYSASVGGDACWKVTAEIIPMPNVRPAPKAP